MPIERYRDPITGKWLTRDAASSSPFDVLRELFETPQSKRERQDLIREGRRVTEYGETPEPNWREEGFTKWGMGWVSSDGRPFNMEALEEAELPAGVGEFQVRYYVPDNPNYPRGYGSTETLMMSEWPPRSSLWESLGGTGIASIYFRYL